MSQIVHLFPPILEVLFFLLLTFFLLILLPGLGFLTSLIFPPMVLFPSLFLYFPQTALISFGLDVFPVKISFSLLRTDILFWIFWVPSE